MSVWTQATYMHVERASLHANTCSSTYTYTHVTLQEKSLPASFRQRSAMPFQVVSFKKNDNKDEESEFEQGLQQDHGTEDSVGAEDGGGNKETGAEKMLMAMGWTPDDVKRALVDERAADVCVAVSWRKHAPLVWCVCVCMCL